MIHYVVTPKTLTITVKQHMLRINYMKGDVVLLNVFCSLEPQHPLLSEAVTFEKGSDFDAVLRRGRVYFESLKSLAGCTKDEVAAFLDAEPPDNFDFTLRAWLQKAANEDYSAPPEKKKVVIESPLRGESPEEQRRNFRYALWCQRWVRLQGHTVYASHTNGPLFLNDSVSAERDLGIALTAEITDDNWEHWFFLDLGSLASSEGMRKAYSHFRKRKRYCHELYLADEAPSCWQAFERGYWPPHTEGLIGFSPTDHE